MHRNKTDIEIHIYKPPLSSQFPQAIHYTTNNVINDPKDVLMLCKICTMTHALFKT